MVPHKIFWKINHVNMAGQYRFNLKLLGRDQKNFQGVVEICIYFWGEFNQKNFQGVVEICIYFRGEFSIQLYSIQWSNITYYFDPHNPSGNVYYFVSYDTLIQYFQQF